jgi:membrane fusion protein, heavy metal efflux system
MKPRDVETLAVCLLAGTILLAGCKSTNEPPSAGAPPALMVEVTGEPNVFRTERPELFPLATAVAYQAAVELAVTGTVNPDISRTVPVITLASGRIVEIDARLGDTVRKGQLLLRVQSADISSAFSDYQKAIADEKLDRTELERAQLLYGRGAISLNDLQVAQDTEDKAKVDVTTTAERLRVLGNANFDQPSGTVEILAPISGVITDQEVTNAAGVQSLTPPNPFTISDLTHVWILCDVYENDLSQVRLGDKADIRLNAYPDRVFVGTISNVGALLDPNIRAAKVRIEVRNPGFMRPGMFVTATFHGQRKENRAAVPSTAILHMHDKQWVYEPLNHNQFRRVEIAGGAMLPANMQEVVSGLAPGQQVVSNALEFETTVEGQ